MRYNAAVHPAEGRRGAPLPRIGCNGLLAAARLFECNEPDHCIIDHLRETAVPAARHKLAWPDRTRNIDECKEDNPKLSRLVILKLGVVPLKEFLRVPAVHRCHQIRKDVVEGLRARHYPRIVLNNSEFIYDLPHALAHRLCVQAQIFK